MKTKKTAQVGNLPGFRKPAEDTAKEEIRETAPATDPARQRFQLSFDLNADGSPDLSAMRGSTKEKVQAFFSDPKMAQAFGVKAPVQAEVQVFHPAMVAGLYSMLGSIEALAVSRMTKIPVPICKQAFTYTPQEIEALTPPTVRVLNKYAADWMIKYQDEIALVTLLSSITISKYNIAVMAAKMSQPSTPSASSQEESGKTGEKREADTRTPIQ